MQSWSPKEIVGSKMMPLMLLFWISVSSSASDVAVERMRLAPRLAVPVLAMKDSAC
jgi:hypothetical protein